MPFIQAFIAHQIHMHISILPTYDVNEYVWCFKTNSRTHLNNLFQLKWSENEVEICEIYLKLDWLSVVGRQNTSLEVFTRVSYVKMYMYGCINDKRIMDNVIDQKFISIVILFNHIVNVAKMGKVLTCRPLAFLGSRQPAYTKRTSIENSQWLTRGN